jgi:hypothetical protein
MSKSGISKAEKIRVSLQLLQPGEDLSAAQLEEVTGIKNVVVHLGSMRGTGEVITTGDAGSYRYKLNPKYTPKRKAGIDRELPVKRKCKKKAAAKPRKATKKKRIGKLRVAPPTNAQERWALASDGALVLLGTSTEIPRTAARALIDFVRVLDQGQA